MHTLVVLNEIPVSKWKRGLSVSYGNILAVSSDPNRSFLSQSWCSSDPSSLVLICDRHLQAPPNLGHLLWTTELDAASQILTANYCSNWQHSQITSATVADGAFWPKGARWAFWTLDSTSWIQLGWLHGVQMEGRGRLRTWGFPSRGSIPNAPLEWPVPAVHYNCRGGCRILLPGQGGGGEAEWKGSLLTLNIRVFPECHQTQHLHCQVF